MELLFDPESHIYRHGGPDGQIMDGVTSIIAVDTTYFTEEARTRGTHVHQMTHLYDEDDLDEDDLDDAYKGYLQAYKKATAETGMTVFKSELQVHSDTHGYAGTLDKLAHFKKDLFYAIVDIKSGAYAGWTELQTAAYARCFPDPHFRYGLELRPDGKYRLWRHTNRRNIEEFLTLLAAKRIRAKYKI